MLSLQPDILPLEYCRALYNLLDRIHPVDVEKIEDVFREEIGKSPDELFDLFDPDPIASGSIGQVHTAWLDGAKVAVKIQRPDAQAGFRRDAALMRAAIWLISCLRLRVLSWMIDPLTEFASWTAEALDFRREARYMQQLRRNASENRRERVPAIVHEYTTRRVLVIEFLEGVTLMDHMRLVADGDLDHQTRLAQFGFDADAFARNIISNFLGDAFQHGIFHADLHPGNLMITPGGDNVVGYIDFGITGVISQFSRHNLVSLSLAYARKDIETLCDRFFRVSSVDARSDPDGFKAGIKRLSEKWYTGSEDDPSLQTTTTMVMLDMLKLSRETRIWPQRDVIKYIRSAIAIDGLIHQFAPEFDVGYHLAAACRRYLSRHARKSLFSHDALINWSKASADLARDGTFRISELLERMSETRDDDTAVRRRRGEGRTARWTVRFQSTIVLCLTLAAVLSSVKSLAVGFNLFTAQLMVITASAVVLLRSRH